VPPSAVLKHLVVGLALAAAAITTASAQGRPDVRTPRYIGNDTCINPYTGAKFSCPRKQCNQWQCNPSGCYHLC
jgi:hypothetical protein